MKKLLLLISLSLIISYPVYSADLEGDRARINLLLDGFHQAAAQGDKTRYLDSFTEKGVFMGTDETERWPLKPDFKRYVEEHFEEGKGWAYTPEAREVAFSADNGVAWFDEVSVSEKWGRFRGTGVVIKQTDGGWKIAHYALSFLVPNDVWEATSALAKKALKDKE